MSSKHLVVILVASALASSTVCYALSLVPFTFVLLASAVAVIAWVTRHKWWHDHLTDWGHQSPNHRRRIVLSKRQRIPKWALDEPLTPHEQRQWAELKRRLDRH